MKKTNISEQTMIGIIWTSVMSSVEWNKKEELVTEQAIKILKVLHQLSLGTLRIDFDAPCIIVGCCRYLTSSLGG